MFCVCVPFVCGWANLWTKSNLTVCVKIDSLDFLKFHIDCFFRPKYFFYTITQIKISVTNLLVYTAEFGWVKV